MRIFLLVLFSTLPLFSHPTKSEPETAAQMKTAADSFLLTLSPKQKATASKPFDIEERENWRYVPSNDRQGILLRSLTPAQRPFVFALLDTGLSEHGILTASAIIALEQYLAEKENDTTKRDPEKYYLTIFGTPSTDESWGWRFEGHHLSLNYSIIEGEKIIFTPAFFGTNPAEILEGPLKGLRPLGKVEDLARAFTVATVEKHPNVIFSQKAPKEIISHQERTATELKPTGVEGKSLDLPLRKLFQDTINSITTHLDQGIARKESINASTASFAWAGSTERGEQHYFRIQSPGILIEYANTQNNANHAHLVIRFTKNDFGRDLLKEHFKEEHSND